MRVALTRLLKKRPSRLLIEPSGLGHVAELSEHLQKEPLSNALELRAVACVEEVASVLRREFGEAVSVDAIHLDLKTTFSRY